MESNTFVHIDLLKFHIFSDIVYIYILLVPVVATQHAHPNGHLAIFMEAQPKLEAAACM